MQDFGGSRSAARTKEYILMAQFFERKNSKQEDQQLAELRRWWSRNPNASMLQLEAVARDLGMRGARRFNFGLSLKRERPGVRV
jgi:hypothetical protein